MVVVLLVLMALFVAYANGANDNFKGVATLYGSNTTNFKTALFIGTIATFAGCVSSVFLAEALVKTFSGKGLVPDVIAASPEFLLAVAAGAASTVMIATVVGIPISTTHALTGALVGAGYTAAGPELNLSVLGAVFLLPLLLSPLVSVLLTMICYNIASASRTALGIGKESCICVGSSEFVPTSDLVLDNTNANSTFADSTGVVVGTVDDCVDKYSGKLSGVSAQSFVDGLHYLSGAVVSFARGLNDTPKIVGLLLVIQAVNIQVSMFAIAIAMATGGLVSSRKVAETMSKKISGMNDGQALIANLVTAFMVIFASRLGMPVSTTHVSVGAISGAGIVRGTAHTSVIGGILLSWVLTLPLAAVMAALAYASLEIG